jgi:formate-dependent phosphoribosylglycinamide formyltransferase (GAR transformylase)
MIKGEKVKNVFILLVSFVGFNVHAQVPISEKIVCEIERSAVNFDEIVKETLQFKIIMSGPHNGEYGQVDLKSQLLPSYKIKFEKILGGATDELTLTSQRGSEIVAKSSADEQQTKQVDNRFLTSDSEYQITVSCTSAR